MNFICTTLFSYWPRVLYYLFSLMGNSLALLDIWGPCLSSVSVFLFVYNYNCVLTVNSSAYLRWTYQSSDVGTGFPSTSNLHVGFTCLSLRRVYTVINHVLSSECALCIAFHVLCRELFRYFSYALMH